MCYTDSFATPPVAVWGWIYALSKIAELGDTAFIVLRKRPLPFLHWYHHVTVLVFTWYSVTSKLNDCVLVLPNSYTTKTNHDYDLLLHSLT